MADINGVNGAGNAYLDLNPKKEEPKAQSQSDMFMQLMIANLKNQDPASPAETSEFMSQISDMTMVEGITNLNKAMGDLSSSMLSSQAALQASSMVGRTVYVPAATAELEAGQSLDGVLELPVSSSGVEVKVFNSSGAQVGSLALGAQQAGDVQFSWPMPAGGGAGTYRVEAVAAGVGGEFTRVETFLGRNVESVTLGQNGVGMKINTAGGSVALADVKQIG